MNDQDKKQMRLRDLPSITAVLKAEPIVLAISRYGRVATTEAIRDLIDQTRRCIGEGAVVPDAEQLAWKALARLDARDRSGLRPLFNLTGIVLHTNFGRAQLADAAVEAATAAMRHAVAVEFSLETGKRGERDDYVRQLLIDLTGAEDATVVNNNAAAVLLCLNTLANGREVVVSRGELIEIGGAFRMPEIMKRAGARMIEVGTTNRTHERDYLGALSTETGLLMKVHTSNYRIQGFTAEVNAARLASIADAAKVPLLNDLGSGSLVDLAKFGLKRESTVRDAVTEGAGLVTFSGDKLLGGPQAGFIVGRRDLVSAINRNPMKRALRVDKIRLSAIEATLKLYRDPDTLLERLPTLRFLARSQEEIVEQADRIRPKVAQILSDPYDVLVCTCESQIGSGALPLDTLPSAAVVVRPKTGSASIEKLADSLRRLSKPIVGRIAAGELLLDLRCLTDELEFLSVLAEWNADAIAN
ncbi:L-seryl-tRNA(Sec) selenium transferase [Tardiphaga sp. 804_B3_N1_9]|uniref:L-seryl-tRNA(Sec) selenium transferase n=1 Tax=Tardiphaga TaxID=1395974 RepID=UPI001586A688|nr:L-seryl-tRNA(Sec) selenium transferase [Tardiphaga robiniae]NUU39650.1 L-seryl-tRNA(Sec) selenium transferase [Tardiphaga robiniae]